MKLLDQLRTEDAYCAWIKQFILFHDKKHPKDMGEEEISEFISYLAVKRFVAASTQKPGFECHRVSLQAGAANRSG